MVLSGWCLSPETSFSSLPPAATGVSLSVQLKLVNRSIGTWKLGQAGAEHAVPRKRGALAQVGFIFFHAASNVVPMLLAVWFASNGEATLECPRRDPDARSTTGLYRMDTLVAKFS